MVAVVLVAMAVIGTTSSLLYIREALEVDKQRLIAVNYARQYLEQIRRGLYPEVPTGETVQLDDFDTPDFLTETSDLNATVDIRVYPVVHDSSSGRYEPDLSSELTSMPESGDRVYVEVEVSWQRTGRRSNTTETEVLQTYVAPR